MRDITFRAVAYEVAQPHSFGIYGLLKGGVTMHAPPSTDLATREYDERAPTNCEQPPMPARPVRKSNLTIAGINFDCAKNEIGYQHVSRPSVDSSFPAGGPAVCDQQPCVCWRNVTRRNGVRSV